MPPAAISKLQHACASSTRLGWIDAGLFGAYRLTPPYNEIELFFGLCAPGWDAGRRASLAETPITLTLTADAPARTLALRAGMDGRVSFVVVCLSGARAAHAVVWRRGEWARITLPEPSLSVRLEFVESEAPVALRAAAFEN